MTVTRASPLASRRSVGDDVGGDVFRLDLRLGHPTDASGRCGGSLPESIGRGYRRTARESVRATRGQKRASSTPMRSSSSRMCRSRRTKIDLADGRALDRVGGVVDDAGWLELDRFELEAARLRRSATGTHVRLEAGHPRPGTSRRDRPELRPPTQASHMPQRATRRDPRQAIPLRSPSAARVEFQRSNTDARPAPCCETET